MPNITRQTFTLADNDIISVESAMAGLKESYGDDPGGVLGSDVDEVIELFRIAKRAGLVARFRDDGFPRLMVLWHWVGEDAGFAYILRGGLVRQINLMLAGVDRYGKDTAIRQFRSSTALDLGDDDWDAIHQAERPTLAALNATPPQGGDGTNGRNDIGGKSAEFHNSEAGPAMWDGWWFFVVGQSRTMAACSTPTSAKNDVRFAHGPGWATALPSSSWRLKWW